MASIKLPDGSIRDVPDGTTVGQLAESIGKRLAQAAVVGRVDGKLVDLAHPLTGSHEVAIVTDHDPDGLYVMRHSTAHVLAQALRHLYGRDVQYTIGPVIENGFFYDFELPDGFSAEDLPKVEAEMQKIVQQDLKFSREDVEPEKAKDLLHGENQRFKDEIIDELECAGERTVSIYRQGDFTDLCRGRTSPAPGRSRRSSSRAWPGRTGGATAAASSSPASTGPRSLTRRNWTSTSSNWKRPSSATTA